jgi:flagellar hook assembly protein FlgD
MDATAIIIETIVAGSQTQTYTPAYTLTQTASLSATQVSTGTATPTVDLTINQTIIPTPTATINLYDKGKNVWMFRNVINPEKGEQCGIVIRTGENDSVKVGVYNKKAMRIKKLLDEKGVTAGYRQLYWDGTNEKGEKVVSGIYLVVIETKNYKVVEKAAVIH